MSLLVTQRKIGGLVKHFTCGSEGRKIVSAYGDSALNEKQVRRYFRSEGVKPSDVDRFISEAKMMGKAYTEWRKVLEGQIDEEGLVERIQGVNVHIKSLDQDIFIGPKEEQDPTKKIEIRVAVGEIPGEEKDSLQLTLSYGLKLLMWLDRLSSLANRRLEEANSP